MLSCDWTEKVSLLVDGELPRAEAATVEAHLAGCADCRAARGEFLFFRRQLGSYRADVSPAAGARALETIFASKSAAAVGEASELNSAPAPLAGWRERLAAALGISRVRPALAASFALAVLAAAVGVAAVYVNSRKDVQTAQQGPAAPPSGVETSASPVETSASPAPHAPDAAADERRRDGGNASASPHEGTATPAADRGQRRREGRRAPPRSPRPAAPQESQAVAALVPPPDESPGRARPFESVAGVPAAPAATRSNRFTPPRAGLDASRHVEQAQLLLRSFRNARATDDLAYERERSQRLLYRNIVLRREAASTGDPVVASMLGRLEPFLVEIANLPDKPATGDVDSIRERMRRKNLVVMLQAGGGMRK